MSIFCCKQKVRNFEIWKKAFDEREAFRVKEGIKSHFVIQSHDDTNHVTIIGEGSSEIVKAFFNSEKLKIALEAAGVIGFPEVFIGENKL